MSIKLISNNKVSEIMFIANANILSKIGMLSCLITIVSIADAKNFGVAGNTFKVVEQGFVSDMQSRMQKIDIKQEQEKMLSLTKNIVNEPKALDLTKASEQREFYFDPTYTLPKDMILPCGKVLHKAGTKVNPLDYMSLERRMIFINGRDKDQVEWLKEELVKYKDKAAQNDHIKNKVILTGGKIFELEKELDLPLFFDQAGELTSRFGIKSVPAVAQQDGMLLKITEIALNESDDK